MPTLVSCETPADSPVLDWALELLPDRWRAWFGETVLSKQTAPTWSLRLDGAVLPRSAGARLQEEGYVLARDSAGRFSIQAKSANGLKNGIFGLLRELGCGDYFGGESIPQAPWATRFPRNSRRTVNPRLSVRGLLPFHNFGNGPTCWERDDYRRYFDVMSAQGMNLAMFHAYDSEPHGAFRFRGRWQPGDVCRNHVRFRGKEALDVTRFPAWARNCFPDPHFGPPDVRGTRTLEQCIEKSQALLRDAFDHARRRGVKICFGFELRGDPRSPEIRERFLARLDHIVETYGPEYIGLWQKENIGQIGWNLPLEDSGWEATWRSRRARLGELGATRRGLEVLRLAEFLNLAGAHLRRRSAPARLVLGGWGGDEWMFLPEMFGALDGLVPPDVVFSALENLDVNLSRTVSAGYGGLSAHRERWPVPWLEADAGLHPSQWHPAASVGALAPLVTDAVKKHCDGVLGIHWRFSGELECEVARFAQACWREESDADFWRDYAARCYGRRAGGPIARQLAALDDLGPAWTGLAPQIECVPFTWESIPELALPADSRGAWKRFREATRGVRRVVVQQAAEARKPISWVDAALFLADWTDGYGAEPAAKRRKLAQIRRRLALWLGREKTGAWPANGARRLRDLVTMIDFVTGFDRVMRLMKPGGPVQALQEEARVHLALGAEKHAARVARRALRLMRREPFDRVLKTYAAQVRSTSQRGNLARMCDEAWTAWEETRLALVAIAK